MNPLKKQKKIMKTKNMIWAALSMTAALVMTACTSEDNSIGTPAAQQAEVKTIPYSVTVGQGGDATTRATVDNDMKTLKFAAGDKLYIIGMNISGVLTLKSGDEGKSSGATFEGSLSYTGEGSPASNLLLAAALVGTNNKGWNIVNGMVNSFYYPDNAYCSSVNDAVEQYSNLTGTSTYSKKSFTLKQQTAFLNFEITFDDGTTAGTELSAVVKNNNGEATLCTANVTTVDDGGVKAKFVLPVMSSATTLSSATVKMGDKEAISFGASQELKGKVYNVKKTQAAAATTLNKTTTAWTAGSYAVPAGGLTYSDAITVSGDVTLTLTDGETLTLNKGISLASGATLTIQGNGTMNVNGSDNSTASTVDGSTGTLILTSGTLTATGGKGEDKSDSEQTGASGGAAINGSVTVNGGSLTANGGKGGNCIGGGYIFSTYGGAGGAAISGDVTITDGAVAATGGDGGSIGASGFGSQVHGGAGGAAIGGNASLTGGTLTATQGANGTGSLDSSSVGAGGKAVAGTVTNNGGTVN